ncbi:MAG TPA: hypothetical protein VMT89_18875 [Candidatus Acidoferrales bacterium]|nr:hypothetical protein [Candidatus Acidoferrales bacterium]
MRGTVAWLVGLWACGLVLSLPVVACTGDCNNDGEVTIDEIVKGVNIALDVLPIGSGRAFDTNGDGVVTIDEVVAAVTAALAGCPATPLPTPSLSNPTPSATPTPLATNAAPVLTPLPIYRSYPGYPIDLALPIADPDGDPLQCAASDLPRGAQFDSQARTFRWTPAEDQLGPFYVPFLCADPTSPAVGGTLIFKVQPPDECGTPTCDPASGCTKALPPVTTNCCEAGPVERIAEPAAGCPEGLAAFVGDNQNGGFGRLQDCDQKRVLNMAQSAAQVRFNLEARCISTDDRPRVHARLETAKRVLFDQEYRVNISAGGDGYYHAVGIPFSVDPAGLPDFTDIQGSEANLTVTVRDAQNQTVTETLRLILTFTPVPDEPDVDPTPTLSPD